MADDLAAQLASAVREGITSASGDLVDKLAAAFQAVVIAPPDPDEGKVSPEQANYRPSSPEGGPRCASCANFVTDGRCKVVKGTIDPNYVSDRYEPRMKVVERTQIPSASRG